MNEKFDRVMSKVGLFLGGVVVTMVGMTVMGTMMINKEDRIKDVEIKTISSNEDNNI